MAVASTRAWQAARGNHEHDAYARDAVPAYELGWAEQVEGARPTDLTHRFVDLIRQAIDLSTDIRRALLRGRRRASTPKQAERDWDAEAEGIHGSLLFDA